MCGYFCIGFIDFMLKCNNLTDYTNLDCMFLSCHVRVSE